MAQTGPQMGRPRHRSFVGPILLIVLGVSILLLNFHPGFDPWPLLRRYWPLILIFIGLGKIWDSYHAREHLDRETGPWISGTGVAWIVIVVFFVLALWHGGIAGHRGWDWDGRHSSGEAHDTRTVDLQGAKSVTADLQFPAGKLDLSGGSSRLLDADFRYDGYEGKPNVDYQVSGDRGQLNVTQGGHAVHFGPDDVDWNLRMGGDALIDLSLNIGAGQSDLRLSGLNLSHLRINMGAGQLHLDLTGAHKTNLDADIEGGVGQATIRLPKDVGVRAVASGGIGAVNANGLKRDGDAYVNDAYGKTPATIDLTVHGGVGEINLVEE